VQLHELLLIAPEAADEIYVINPTQIESIARAGDISTGAFTGQTELAEQAANDDVLLIYDTSTNQVKKIQKIKCRNYTYLFCRKCNWRWKHSCFYNK
jgi:hypothetical protein